MRKVPVSVPTPDLDGEEENLGADANQAPTRTTADENNLDERCGARTAPHVQAIEQDGRGGR
jgi:hypothetical protein